MTFTKIADRFRHSLNSIMSKFKSLFPFSPQVWALVVLPFTIGLSFVLSLGPTLQFYVLSLLNSDEPSIYGTAYQEAIIRFPGLGEWMSASFNWYFLMLSFFISTLALRNRSLRRVALSVALLSAISLTILDVLFSLFQDTFSGKFLIINVTSNFIGSVGIAFAACLILLGYDLCTKFLPTQEKYRKIVAAGSPILFGIFTSVFFFYTVELFYRPVPIKTDIYIDPPISGAFAIDHDATSRASDIKSDATFRMIPERSSGGQIEYMSPGGQLRTNWKTTSTSDTFDVSIDFFDNCLRYPTGIKLSGSNNGIRLGDIKSLEIWFDEGVSHFWTLDSLDSSDNSIFELATPTPFWINFSKESENVEITQALFESDELLRKINHEITYYLSAPLLTIQDGTLYSDTRVLHFRADATDFEIIFEAQGFSDQKEKIYCKEIAIQELAELNQISVDNSNSPVGVLIHIRRRPKESLVYHSFSSELRLSGGSGYAKIEGISERSLSDQQLGRVSFLDVSKGLSSLEIDGKEYSIKKHNHLFIIGQLEGTFTEFGQMRFLGSARVMWKDGQRINPTKWERFDWKMRTVVFGPVLSLLMALFLQVFKRLKEDYLILSLSHTMQS